MGLPQILEDFNRLKLAEFQIKYWTDIAVCLKMKILLDKEDRYEKIKNISNSLI